MLVTGAIGYLISTTVGGRLLTLVNAVQSGSFAGTGEISLPARAWMYKKGFELALENPVIGIGLDVFRTSYVNVGQAIGNNSHSNYIEVLASTGFVGAFLYFGMYYSWWSKLAKGTALLQSSTRAANYAVAASLAAAFLALDVGWATYYEKLPWLIIPGLIAEVNLITAHSRVGGARPELATFWRRVGS